MNTTFHPSEEGPNSDREYLLNRSDFKKIADLAYAESGILLPESKEPLVYSRLVKRLRTLGLKRFSDYVAILENEAESEERQFLISALTTNTTRFCRESHHFDYLAREVLPRLVSEARRGRRVRLWSAACSTGEEAYELSFAVLDQCPEAASLDIKILATDIDPQVLLVAERGIYSIHATDAFVSDGSERFFTRLDAANCQVRASARELVNFRQMNLIKPWPVRGPFDVVFCRNVAIYFDQATQDKIWHGFDSVMKSGGVLFIGHSERLSASLKTKFEMVGMTTFVKVDGWTKPGESLEGAGQCH